MDERESLYFDTISLADSEAAAAAHRKSLSQSRNTIYHSAVDLAGDEARNSNSLRLASGHTAEHMRLAWHPRYRQSTALEHLNGGASGGDHTDAAIAAQVLAFQNGGNHLPKGAMRNGAGGMNDDEPQTSRRFSDGKRSVDFVLAYRASNQDRQAVLKRKNFEENLEREGLQLEYHSHQSLDFVNLHAPAEVLHRYAEILKIKMPLNKLAGQELIIAEETLAFNTCFTRMWRTLFSSVQPNNDAFPEREQRIHMEFACKYLDLYDKEHPNYFDDSTRYSIINFIMQRQHFKGGEEKADNLGIDQLIKNGVYLCAFPLHDEEQRRKLLKEWANIGNWIRLQPLDHIKDYFGAKVALYFAWLGFYTQMLIPVSVLGIFIFLYGFVTWNSDPISYDICNDNATVMCPQCDRGCTFWQLNETCTSSKFNYLIDNKMTLVFALVMAIWAVIYLELWKRYSAGLVHRWGLTGFTQHTEHPRPQYLEKINNYRPSDNNQHDSKVIIDPDVPFWSIKFLPNFTSYSIMVLFICISVIGVASIVIYRMAQRASTSILSNQDSTTYKLMVLPITAGLLDLVLISILDLAYSALAVRLTNYEYCRTQTDYDESLTIKNYVFQFVNYYSSLFYIAFLKGKFVGYPSKYNRIFSFRQEECNPGGCLMELCMQLVIIMVGKQAVNAIVEMLIPFLMRTAKKFKQRNEVQNKQNSLMASTNRFTNDFNLLPVENNSLYAEYLEMVMQYGFITLFSLAFPLAPLLALINNVLEMRLDAIKMLRFVRRPVGMRARNIGVWHGIMNVITHIAVASSAMIIAFSTNFIPKLVYRATHDDPELDHYLNFTLATFYTKDFETQSLLNVSAAANVTQCRYSEFRNDPWQNPPYKRPMIYWKILTARLAFIVIYQNIIAMLQGIVRWAVPDVSGRLLKRIKRENFLLREHIIEYERNRAQNLSQQKKQTQTQSHPTLSAVVNETQPKDAVRQRLNFANDATGNDSATTYV